MEIIEKLEKLADKINDSIVYKQQVWDKRDDGQWDKFWSAYYVLRDAQWAIDEWKEVENPQRLEMYGLLQALVVQQDALRHVQEAMDCKSIHIKNDYPDLHEIRIARNQLAGHPSQTEYDTRNYKDGTRTHTTIGYSDNSKIIEYVVSSGKGSKRCKFSLLDSITTQESILYSEVDNLTNKIDCEDMSHKSGFKDDSLRKKLHTSTYLASKAYSFEQDNQYARLAIGSLSKIYDNFKKEVCSRYKVSTIDETIHAPGLVGELEKIDKMLPRVQDMLLNRDKVDNLDLDVYAEVLTNSFRLLEKMAEEIDEEFKAQDTIELKSKN